MKRAYVASAPAAPQRVCDGCFNRLIDEVADRHFQQQPLDNVEIELLSRLSESPVEPTPLSAAEALYEYHQHVANGVDADTRLVRYLGFRVGVQGVDLAFAATGAAWRSAGRAA